MPESRQRKRAAARTAKKQSQKKLTPTPSTPPPPLAAQSLTLHNDARERWRSAAIALTPEQVTFSPSVRVLLDESPRAARFVERYWEPAVDPGTGAQMMPGLKSASRRLERSVAGEIMELHGLTQEAHGLWLLASGGAGSDPFTRGWFVLGEIRATLEFLADEGAEGDLVAQLARVRNAHAQDGESREDLASALDDYATIARLHADEMHGVGDFDRAMIAEASNLAAALRTRPDAQLEAAGEARQKIDLRNRYAALLFDRVSTVRSVARFVFRHHPAIAREATSAWERNRRAASRRKKKDEKPAEPT
jgi:hypothetical protein